MNNQDVIVVNQGSGVIADLNGVIFVAMKPVIDSLKLCWGQEYAKIWPVKEKLGCIYINILIYDDQDDSPSTIYIPLNQLNDWLSSINSLKVAEKLILLRIKVETYQEECFQALCEYQRKLRGNNTKQIYNMGLLVCEYVAKMLRIKTALKIHKICYAS